MGWDGVEVNKILTKKEIKAKLDDFYGPLDSELVSDVWYGAMDSCKFGKYFQDSKSKKTPIEWLILDIDNKKMKHC